VCEPTPSGDASDVSADAPETIQPALITVDQLLTQSRAHHATYRQYANRKSGQRPDPDYAQAEQAIASALDTRLQAQQLDPDHTDPAWALDRGQHDALIAFYAKYPTIP
jgi:hypothetical protein